MHIRSRLLTLVLAVLVPSLFAAALGIWYVYQEEQRSLRQSMRETTRALAQVLDKEIASRQSLLRTLAASPALSRGDFHEFYEHAKGIATTLDTTILLSDPQGRQLLNTRLPFGTPNLPAQTMLTALRKEAGPDALVVSGLYYTPVGKGDSFAVQLPVRRDGQIQYYIAMSSFVSQLQAVLNQQRLPDEWLGNIMDRKGTVMARSQEAEQFVGRNVGEERLKRLAARDEGFHESDTFRGEPVVAFFSRVPSSGWTFLVAVPRRILYQSALNATAITGGAMMLLLCTAVFAALALGHKTARSVEILRQSAERLGRGQRLAALRSGTVEIDAVSAAMAKASEDIQSATLELERRVSEAVASAEQSQRALLQSQKLEALGRLTGGIAHDFNNVLQTLTTGLQVLHLSAREERQIKMVETCRRAVGRGVELARQLMVFGRVQDARMETISLPRQIQAATPMLKGALPSNIEFRATLAEPLWPVTVDPLQFELALLNLTMNARDAMPKGGMIELEVRNLSLGAPLGDLSAGDYVCCSLADSGEGMPTDVLASAFDPFFTTKSVGKGSGMGLPQAYGFARQCGGTLLLKSEVGQGTVATFYLPRSRQAPERKQIGTHRPIGGARGRVLFVEDDELVRASVSPALEAAGFQVTVAESGDHALRLLDGGAEFDLAFSDVVMPGAVSGIDLAQQLQRRFPRMRVVLATGYSERRIGIPGVKVLPKPYNLSDVIDALSDDVAVA